jgi:hypothetical protein
MNFRRFAAALLSFSLLALSVQVIGARAAGSTVPALVAEDPKPGTGGG